MALFRVVAITKIPDMKSGMPQEELVYSGEVIAPTNNAAIFLAGKDFEDDSLDGRYLFITVILVAA